MADVVNTLTSVFHLSSIRRIWPLKGLAPWVEPPFSSEMAHIAEMCDTHK